jgi:hypothetical protein
VSSKRAYAAIPKRGVDEIDAPLRIAPGKPGICPFGLHVGLEAPGDPSVTDPQAPLRLPGDLPRDCQSTQKPSATDSVGLRSHLASNNCVAVIPQST